MHGTGPGTQFVGEQVKKWGFSSCSPFQILGKRDSFMRFYLDPSYSAYFRPKLPSSTGGQLDSEAYFKNVHSVIVFKVAEITIAKVTAAYDFS